MLKQSTAATILVGPVLDSAGAAVTTAVIGDFQATKNGTSAALASPATATHSHNGFYLLALTTSNTDTVGRLVISVNNTAQSMSTHRYTVLLPSVFDALITNATNTNGGLPAATGAISALAGAVSTLTAGGVRTELATELARIDTTVSSRLATVSYTAPPSAATNATAVRTELTTELARIDATVSSRSTLTAAGVRTELATELARIDATVSSRLAAISYVAPDNATIGAISINLGTVNDNVLSRLAASSYVAPLSASETRLALGLTSANLDTQLADIPTVTEFEARTLIASGYASSTHWTSTRAGYLDSVLLAANSNRTVQVTGSNHVASVVHSVEPAAISENAFADNALSNRVLAANAAAEVATAVRTELTVELARIDVTSSSRLASSAYTAPDNAGITLIKTVTDRLNTGLVQDGAVWQFTVNMLENGPAGGGGGSGDATLANQVLILGQLDVIQNKTDLLNPAPTGSILLVDSGEFYCTRQDVELIFGKSSVRTWADVDNEGDEDFISDRILTMIALAHEQTNDGLRNGGYVVPFTPPRPASLVYNVAALAGVLLYESRGAIDADNEDGTHRLTPYRKRWDKYIKQLLSQQVRIDATRQNATTAPAVY